MDLYEKTKIRLYEVFIRDLINSVVNKIKLEELKEEQTFLSEIKRKLHFDNINGWKFLTSALDTIGDAQFAIIEFCNDKKINYLQLYGVLSAIYIQQRSIIKMCDLVKINEKNIKAKFDNLDITFLRHCISAHPINYSNNGKITSFKIDRNSITNKGLLNVRAVNNEAVEYNIFNLITSYNLLAEQYLHKISNKIIDNIYKTAKEKAIFEKEKLSQINVKN